MKTPQHAPPFSLSSSREREELLARAVLSVSGWRLCFGSGPDSPDSSITPAQRDFVMVTAHTFLRFLQGATGEKNPVVALGTDTRPTGPALADTVMRTFLHEGIRVEWLGIVASPEIMAYTKVSPHLKGFFYITASHNPRGYNGFKFGLADGAVLPGRDAWPLIERFREDLSDQERVAAGARALAEIPAGTLEQLERERALKKSHAAAAYRGFVLRVASGSDGADAGTDRFVTALRAGLAEAPLGVVAELNGSARTTSVDRALFPFLGVRTALHNDRPGEIRHQILPEGTGLAPAAELLQEYHRKDPAFQVAYVPDNDGDRGNLVFMERTGAPVILEAQQVFALTVMIELAWLRYLGRDTEKASVVVNGPTSIRVDEIARWFGAEVCRAEVGEANVVALAEERIAARRLVPVLGEGSNGGSITPPATVRDPLSALLALLKLHSFPLDRIIREAAGESPAADPPAAGSPLLLLDTARLIPPFTTTATDDARAKMEVGAVRHGRLKEEYERLVPDRIGAIMPELERALEVQSWEFWNYEGTRAVRGPGNRTGAETGGLRVLFLDNCRRPRASVWMRGSGTEPVFRVMADCAGLRPDLADRLIRWQRETVREAVREATGRP